MFVSRHDRTLGGMGYLMGNAGEEESEEEPLNQTPTVPPPLNQTPAAPPAAKRKATAAPTKQSKKAKVIDSEWSLDFEPEEDLPGYVPETLMIPKRSDETCEGLQTFCGRKSDPTSGPGMLDPVKTYVQAKRDDIFARQDLRI